VSTRVLRIVTQRPSSFAVGLAVLLLVANVIAQPDFIAPDQIAPTLGTLAPFVIVGMASTLAFLSGGGGIDLSIAPLMGLTNIVLVTVLFGTSFGGPLLAVPILLALGALVGALNGVMVARLRYPPVIATLGTFFVLAGLDLRLVPTPSPPPATTGPTTWPARSGRCPARC
jgi:ribose transport system permease protein